MKILSMLMMTLMLTHCASAPKPPHCKDNGKGLTPVNKTPVEVSREEKYD